ncbi:DUF333 domain-containing protein [Vreelandella hamiltonii]|uniref:DUF333 domain-containing protein n=1 Tax=Vreelandella hamiltonii TaxID=502829 RepID=A0A8H9LS57_9GAMM|nr:DUF333 domain-containing protein [Halomonas hamiltonii]GGW21511.1 hypothetical protein GCM10007157_08820 [Halomonas hamiltonii]
MRLRYWPLWVAVGMTVLLAGCATAGGEQAPSMQAAAAEHCEARGGERITRESRLGTGRYCRLPDGRVENEWHLYRTERLDNF